ncbi:MAG: 1-acyl-sn-glycerol-3-phosphate acyltransferase [Saccharospirillaceae bacterium]|nr:1-acyl-sn-glycerol-3-phosphate acyltransferase [Pseudomonadales bacterium]NRB78816.1 1-acyl-sn-glycerol-3-phosphate acyltransferase [Saccharospirillaceae bacterium]
MRNFIAGIRTVVFMTLLWGIITPLWCIPMLILGRLIPKNKRSNYIVRPYAYVAVQLARFICGIKYEVIGLENIPKNRGVVIACNHQSTWETFFLQILFTPQTQVIKKSLLNIPLFGWTFRLQDPIAIDRDAKSKALKQIIKEGTAKIAAGVSVSIFPEGTRSSVNEVAEFSPGAAMLAKKANCNLLPVSLNPGVFWRKDTWLKYPGTVTVVIHPEISVENTKATNKILEDTVRSGVKIIEQGI